MKLWAATLLPTLAVIALPVVAGEADRPDRVAIPLLKPDLRTPEQAIGSGLAPQVSVEVLIDERGKVTDVRVTGIEPSSPLDNVFRGVTIDTLSEWRFAPRLIGGQHRPSRLSFTVQFPERQIGVEPARRPWRLSELDESFNEIQRSHLTALDPAAWQKIQQAAMASAEELINRTNRREVRTENFVVVSDAPPEMQVARNVAHNLEKTFVTLHELFDEAIEPRPKRVQVAAYVLTTERRFLDLLRKMGGSRSAAGFYSPLGVLGFHLELRSSELLEQSLLHQAAQAYLDQFVKPAGRRLPLWLDHGLAEYVGQSSIREGQLELGTRRKARSARASQQSVALAGLGAVRGELRTGKTSLAKIIRSRNTGWMRESIGPSFFARSWVAVHFLRHGDKKWAAEAFPTFLLYVVEGFPADQAFEAAYGGPAVRFNGSFKKYIDRF